MEVRGGELLEVSGPAVSGGGWSFVPAVVTLSGDSLSFECPLANHLLSRADMRGSEPARLALEKMDAIWARARIHALFGVVCPPEAERAEKTLMGFQFVATPSIPCGGAPPHGVAFECSDYYGASALLFADDIPEAQRAAIGAALWDLLLRAPEELADYEDRAYHTGAGVWMNYGCRHGELLYSESNDDDEADDDDEDGDDDEP